MICTWSLVGCYPDLLKLLLSVSLMFSDNKTNILLLYNVSTKSVTIKLLTRVHE